MDEKKIKLRRTLTAPFLVLICYIAMKLTTLIDPESLSSQGNVFLSLIVLQMLIFLIPGIIYCKLRGEPTRENLRIRGFGLRKVLFSVFAFFALLSGAALIKLGLYALGYYSTSYTLYENFMTATPTGFAGFVYVMIALAILPAVTEEFVFRGILLQEYRTAGCSKSTSLILSSLLFAMLHFNIAQLPVYFFGGVAFGCVMMVTDSLFAAVLVHFLNNAFSLFFETQILQLIMQTDSMIFVLFVFAAAFLIFFILALHTAEGVLYERGESGAKPLFKPASNKRERAKYKDRLLEAVISPSFLLCIAAFFAITFGFGK